MMSHSAFWCNGVRHTSQQFLGPVEDEQSAPQEKSCVCSGISSAKREIGVAAVFWGLLLFFICPFLTTFIVYFFVGLFGNFLEIERISRGEMTLLLLNSSMAGMAVALVGWPLFLSYRRGAGSLAKDFGLDWKIGDLFWGLIGGLCCIGAMFVGGFIWYAVTGSGNIPTNAGFLRSFGPDFFVPLNVFLLIAVWTPAAEEIFFRGLALRVFAKRWGKRAAIVISSLIFGLLHVPFGAGLGTCLFLFGVTFSYGVIFAVLAVAREGRLGASIAAHCFLNSAVVFVQFSAVS